jgi:hypothetical protein
VFVLAPRISPSCHRKFGEVLREVELPLLRDCLRSMPTLAPETLGDGVVGNGLRGAVAGVLPQLLALAGRGRA